jgi:hypothetical protein
MCLQNSAAWKPPAFSIPECYERRNANSSFVAWALILVDAEGFAVQRRDFCNDLIGFGRNLSDPRAYILPMTIGSSLG